jgi:hypothetical protein
MGNNIQLLRTTLCRNKWLAERIALYGTGLGSNTTSCTIISGVINKGDGHTVCGKEAVEAITKGSEGQYQASTIMHLELITDAS